MKRVLVFCAALFCLVPTALGDEAHFYPNGTTLRFTVDEETLAATPRWNPGEGLIPLGADEAIRIAASYHDSIKFNGKSGMRKWRLSKAILVAGPDGRWYWVVSYRGPLDPKQFGGRAGALYPRSTTLYNHYPVLLDGTMPKGTERPTGTVADLLKVLEDDSVKLTGTEEWPWYGNDPQIGGG